MIQAIFVFIYILMCLLCRDCVYVSYVSQWKNGREIHWMLVGRVHPRSEKINGISVGFVWSGPRFVTPSSVGSSLPSRFPPSFHQRPHFLHDYASTCPTPGPWPSPEPKHAVN